MLIGLEAKRELILIVNALPHIYKNDGEAPAV
jgi:hypothetical protein